MSDEKAFVYLDESGDLGFSFEKPYRNHGSSRFLTIACIIVKENTKNQLKRLVKKFYKKYHFDINQEIKGTKLNPEQWEFLQKEMMGIMTRFPETQLLAITVKKENVRASIRQDANKLYNYMIKRVLLNHIKNLSMVDLVRDNRSIKVKSGNSLADYLQTELLFDPNFNSDTQLRDLPSDSKQVRSLILVDWFVHMIWKEYENDVVLLNNDIKSRVIKTELCF